LATWLDASRGHGGEKLERRAREIWEKIRDRDGSTNLRFDELEWFVKRCGFDVVPTKMGCKICHERLREFRTEFRPITLHRKTGKKEGFDVCYSALGYVEGQILFLIRIGYLDLDAGD
jgi:hypothetical protein